MGRGWYYPSSFCQPCPSDSRSPGTELSSVLPQVTSLGGQRSIAWQPVGMKLVLLAGLRFTHSGAIPVALREGPIFQGCPSRAAKGPRRWRTYLSVLCSISPNGVCLLARRHGRREVSLAFRRSRRATVYALEWGWCHIMCCCDFGWRGTCCGWRGIWEVGCHQGTRGA